MKQFLSIIVLVSVGAYASGNPFDLQKNLEKIDQDQDVLLSALKDLAQKKEESMAASTEALAPSEIIADLIVEEDDAVVEDIASKDTTEADKDEETDVESREEAQVETPKEIEKEVVEEVEEEKVGVSEEALAPDAQKLQEEERLRKVAEAQVKIEQERAEQARQEEARAAEMQVQKAEEAAKLAAQKSEQERLEVEAYEANRRAKKEQEDARLAAAKEAETKAAEMKTLEVAKNAIVDINITREEQVAKQEADKAYLEAIKEMQ